MEGYKAKNQRDNSGWFLVQLEADVIFKRDNPLSTSVLRRQSSILAFPCKGFQRLDIEDAEGGAVVVDIAGFFEANEFAGKGGTLHT